MAGTKIGRQGAPFFNFQLPTQTITADGAIAPQGGHVRFVNASGTIAATLTPENGQVYFFDAENITTSATVTLGGGFTWDGTNDVATFDADGEALAVMFANNRAVLFAGNPSTIAFS